MSLRLSHLMITAASLWFAGFSVAASHAQQPSTFNKDAIIPATVLVQPNVLVHMMQSQGKPLILQVGSHVLYAEAHLPGSEYVGAAGSTSGIAALRERLSKVSKDQLILIYCGCCPWDRCPNIRPAYEQLHAMGFKHVRALYVDDNFGKNWVDKGYPTDKGR